MVSISYGYHHKIDPLIIAHPANCKLMRQTEDKRKGTKISISLEELIERIKKWNTIYKLSIVSYNVNGRFFNTLREMTKEWITESNNR